MTDLIRQLQQAETDAMAVTLQPYEVSALLNEISDWCQHYKDAAEHRDRVRSVARESLVLLRQAGNGEFADRLESAIWGK